MQLEESVVFVTGGASGFGYHVVQKLLIYGVKVIVADLDKEKGNMMTREVDATRFLFVECDVTFRLQVKEAVEQAYLKFGKIDVIIN